MIKKLFILTLVLGMFLVGGVVLAKTDNNPNQDLPETDGIYDVPGHPNLKLRVIVHHGKPAEKPAKPGQITPTLVCGLQDNDSSAEVSPAGWYMPTNWTYHINTSSVPSSVGSNNLSKIAENSFSPWQKVIGAVNITRGSDTNINRATRDDQNIITWGRTSGTALATTYIWYDTSSYPYKTVELDTIMNQKFKWAWSDPSTWTSQTDYVPGTTCAFQGVYDAQDIMTHELGHWYGLDDEYTSNYTNNTMYGYGYTGQTSADTITTGDKLGVQAIYNQ